MRNNKSYIVFDIFGVLITEAHMIRNTLRSMLSSNISYEKIKLNYKDYDLKKITNREFWNNVGITDYKDFEKKYLDKFVIDTNYQKVINTLKKKYKLGIISNLPSEWADYLIRKFDFEKDFEVIITSGKVGYLKPDKKIFWKFQKRAKIEFNEMVFIDDRLVHLKTANSLGIQTVWMKKEEDKYKFNSNNIITNLIELLTLY